MLRHIVMFRFGDGPEGTRREDNARHAKAALEALPAKIAEIDRLEVGLQALDDPTACDLVLTVDVADEAALHAYARHPDHLEVVALIKKSASARHVVDYFVT